MTFEPQLICGDALEELKKLPDKSVDLIVTDPPYNLAKNYGAGNDTFSREDFKAFNRAWLKECTRIAKDTASIYCFMGMRGIASVYTMLEEELGWSFNSWISWVYTQGLGKQRGFSSRHDDILFFNKNSKKFTFNLDDVRVPQQAYRKINNMRGANPSNVWEFSHVHFCAKNRQPHPTQKPEALFERMILASSNEGDTVLDPFMGSGTSMRVCQVLNRRGIGIEINEDFFSRAQERLREPFVTFDSYDKRNDRIPTGIPKDELEKYMKKHEKWFRTPKI